MSTLPPKPFPGTTPGPVQAPTPVFPESFTPAPLTFWVAGTQFRPDWKGTLREITNIPNDSIHVSLVGEPSNKYDKYAVKVLINERFVGYIPKTDNVMVWGLVSAGWKPLADLASMVVGNPSHLTYKIEVTFVKKPKPATPTQPTLSNG